MSVISVIDFCGFTKLDEEDVNASLLERVIAAAQRRCESYCRGREFEVADHDEYHDIPNATTDHVYVLHPPLNSLTTLSDDAQADTPTTITSADYITDAETGRIRLYNSTAYFTSGPQAVRVQYSGGWADEDLPADLWFACIYQAAAYWNNLDNAGLESESGDAGSVVWDTGEVCAPARNLLRPYVLWRFE